MHEKWNIYTHIDLSELKSNQLSMKYIKIDLKDTNSALIIGFEEKLVLKTWTKIEQHSKYIDFVGNMYDFSQIKWMLVPGSYFSYC